MDENPLDGVDINELLDPQRYKTTLNEAKANWQGKLAQLKVDLDVLELSLEELPAEGDKEEKAAASALLNLRKQVLAVATRIRVINKRLDEAKENDEKLLGKKGEKEGEESGD